MPATLPPDTEARSLPRGSGPGPPRPPPKPTAGTPPSGTPALSPPPGRPRPSADSDRPLLGAGVPAPDLAGDGLPPPGDGQDGQHGQVGERHQDDGPPGRDLVVAAGLIELPEGDPVVLIGVGHAVDPEQPAEKEDHEKPDVVPVGPAADRFEGADLEGRQKQIVREHRAPIALEDAEVRV